MRLAGRRGRRLVSGRRRDILIGFEELVEDLRIYQIGLLNLETGNIYSSLWTHQCHETHCSAHEFLVYGQRLTFVDPNTSYDMTRKLNFDLGPESQRGT